MKVLQICHDHAGPFPAIARQYAAAFEPGAVTTVFLKGVPNEAVEAEIPGTVKFLSLNPGDLRGLRGPAVRALGEAAGPSRPQVIIAHRYKPLCVALRLNRRLRPNRILGVMHEYGFLRRFSRALHARCWPANVHLAGVSAPVVAEAGARAPRLADSGRLHLVSHCLDRFDCLPPASARRELGIPSGKYCFGVVGRLVAKKNHKILLQAMAGVDDAVLALVGGGKLAGRLREQARELGLGDRVVFAGPRENARRLMTAFDAFVLPSTRQEAFGMVLLEAAQAGLPIICADVPGPRSVLAEGATYFKEGDALDLRRKMKEQMASGKDHIERLVAVRRCDMERRHGPGVMRAALRRASGFTEHV